MSPSNSTPAPDEGDAEIVRLLQERDANGLRLLLATHGGRISLGLKRNLGDRLTSTDLDDVLNTAALRVWRRIDSFDPTKGTLRAWFFVIARNAAVDQVRDRQSVAREVPSADLEQLAAPATAPDGDAAELTPTPPRAFLETLRQCIDALPRLQRSIIQADLQSGDTADAGELAEQLRTTKNSVYVSRSNARKALKQLLLDKGCRYDEHTNRLSWA